MRRFATSLLLATTVCAAIIIGPAAHSGPEPHSYVGHWGGFSRSVGNPDIRGPMTLDVSSQRGRTFAGDVCLPPGPCTPVRGSIAESGRISMTGRSSAVRNLVIEAGTPRGYIPCVFVGRYSVTFADGTRDSGHVAAVHQVPNAEAPSFAGDWTGRSTDPRGGDPIPVEASFSQDRSGAITGRGVRGGTVFDLAAQAVGDVNESGVLLASATADALLAADLRLVQAEDGPHLMGAYRLQTSTEVLDRRLDLAPVSQAPR